MRCYILIVMGIIVAASVSGCGGRHGAVSTSVPVQGAPSANSFDASNELGTADGLNANWPSDQELIQRYIAAKAAKEIASAPARGASGFTALGDEVKIDDLRVEAVGDEYYLSWTYRNPGDYNLDTIVNTQDYTPLAQYFGKHVSDEPAAQIVDGNGDGIVNPADIGIIALYYQRHCSSAQLYWSPDGSSFEPIYSDSTLSRLEGEPPTCRIRIPYHHEHGWFRVAPEFSYLGEGPLSDPVQHLPVESAPIIKSVSPYRPRVYPYDTLEFSASFTAAKPYTVTWDFGEENDLLGTTSYDDEFAYAQFYKPGVNLCSLTVENAIGKATHRFVVFVESDFYTDPPVINSVNPKRSFTTDERVTFEPSGHDLYETEFYWDFGGAAEPGYPMEYKPSVVMGAPGRYYASLLVANPVGYTIYHFVINIVHGDSEVEPNDTSVQADRLPPADMFEDFTLNASIGAAENGVDTTDWYQIHLPLGQLVTAKCSQGIVMRVYDPYFKEVPESVGTVEDMLGVTFLARKEGSFYIVVTPTQEATSVSYELTITSKAYRPLSETEFARLVPQKVTFPLVGFSGEIGYGGLAKQIDNVDNYKFTAQAGSVLRLRLDTESSLGDYKLNLGIWHSSGSSTTEFYSGNPIEAEWYLRESGTYRLQIYSPNTVSAFYTLNGELITDQMKVLDVTPATLTQGVPTTFSATIPGGESASYSWDFGSGAQPRYSSLRNPSITCDTLGMHDGVLRIQTNGPVTTHHFTYYVSSWKRRIIFSDTSDMITGGLAISSAGEIFVGSTSDSSPLMYLSGSSWLRDTTYPGTYYIRENSLTLSALGEPVISHSAGAMAFGVMTKSGGLWNDVAVDSSKWGHGSYITTDTEGNLRAIYIKQNFYSDYELYYAEESAGSWTVMKVGNMMPYTTDPALAIDSQGYPYVLFCEHQPNIGDVMSLAHWDGVAWTYEQLLSWPENHGLEGTAQLCVDADDNPHLYYNDYDPVSIKHKWKDTEWHQEVVYTPAEGGVSNWALTTDSQHEPWMIVYETSVDGAVDFGNMTYYPGDFGLLHHEPAGWKYELILHNTLVYDAGDLALDNNGKPCFIYYDRDISCMMYTWRE